MGDSTCPLPLEARTSVEVDDQSGLGFPAHPARKRSKASTEQSLHASQDSSGVNKLRKVSRACDFCKSRKAKCSGDQPCTKCLAKGVACLYDAKYTRGRPPTPPTSDARLRLSFASSVPPIPGGEREVVPVTTVCGPPGEVTDDMEESRRFPHSHASTAPSRASPELGMAEIRGQVFDPTSGLTFLHRALKRVSDKNKSGIPDMVKSASENQPIMTAGDKPLPQHTQDTLIRLPDPAESRRLLCLYFEVCIATYRIVHRPTVEAWLSLMERNLQNLEAVWKGVGRARAAIVLGALAVASLHQAKSKGFLSPEEESSALAASDELYSISARLADEEHGFPKLESAQVRIVQVLYLLTTSRFNRGWYVFGTALQLISALGLHRRVNAKWARRSSTDYIHTQCGIRTFWSAYILDNYLGVVFGRPRHFHDEDIDQAFPDRVNDEDMTAEGPGNIPENPEDCAVDSLVFHAKIAQVIGSISREVYTFQDITQDERVAAATRLIKRVHEWHASLPVHLGSVRPFMLIPSYRRQAIVLKLAHSHAIMHANRLFLLSTSSSDYEDQVNECMGAARNVLETVDRLAQEGPIFHAFWWTHYVTFCALVVTYVWEIQQRRSRCVPGTQNRAKLMELAEKCQTHLANATASNSPSRRYSVILEEFQEAATNKTQTSTMAINPTQSQPEEQPDFVQVSMSLNVDNAMMADDRQVFTGEDSSDTHLFGEWNTTDWLDLDSSAFWPNMDVDDTMLWPSIT